MSSILTNTGAMVALQTLNMTNKSLNDVQGQISTGKKIADARANASVWAIAQTMQSDVDGFNGISDSLATGSATVAVARTASETVTDLLIQIKEKVVAAQDASADTTKLQADTNQLIGQIQSVVGSAQFNGVNLVNAGTNISVLASIDRDGTGAVTPSNITVTAQDLSSTAAAAAIDAFADGTGAAAANEFVVGADGDTAAATLEDGQQADILFNGANYSAGDQIAVTINDTRINYTVTAEDIAATSPDDVIALNVKAAIDAEGIADLTVDYDVSAPGELMFNNGTGADMNVTLSATNQGAGGLATLNGFDITSVTAVADIETMITTAIDAAAAFGSVQTRIDIQSDFVTQLTDSLKTGIGALVDANMEEASARLQALQVQQQLGIQALSIANQAPQNLLSLFR
jgi:flagellin